VVDEGSNYKKIHFNPKNKKSNRDEDLGLEDSNKIAPVFTNSEISADPEKDFTSLREYLELYRKNNATNKKEEIKSSA